MQTDYQDILMNAAAAEIGIIVQTEDADYTRQKLTQQAKSDGITDFSFLIVHGEVWIVRRRIQHDEEKL